MGNKRTRGQRGKNVNVDAMFIFYCTPDEEMRLPAYSDVAKQFGVSVRVVEKYGTKFEWVKKREAFGKEQVKKAEETILEQIEAASKRHLDNYVELEGFAMAQIREQKSLFHGKTIKGRKYSAWAVGEASEQAKRAMNGQRVILGLPTEVSKADVTQTNRNLDLPVDQIEEMDKFLQANDNKHPKTG